MPSISGILPIKDGQRWIARNFPRILVNLAVDDELVVIDDGSTDASYKMVMSFAESDERIIVRQTKGIGLVDSLNLGISASKYDWLARFDIDDFYSRDRISLQRARIENSVSAIFCDYRILHNGKSNLGLIPSPLNEYATRISLLRSQRTAHPSVIINKSKLLKVGGYLQNEYPAEDLGLWTRLASVGQLVSIPHEGLYYNLRKGSISRENQDLISNKRELIIDKFMKNLDIDLIYNSLNATEDIYSSIPYGRERTLLHYWDLLHSKSRELLGHKRAREIEVKLGRLLLNPLNSSSVLSLAFYRGLRRFYK